MLFIWNGLMILPNGLMLSSAIWEGIQWELRQLFPEWHMLPALYMFPGGEPRVNITWRPTRILLVKAPSGKEAWTRGTVVLLRIPPSGPIWLLSCLIRETTAKYWGKSFVIILQILFFPNSSGLSSSEKTNEWTKPWE